MPAEQSVQHSPGEWEYDESTGQVDVPDGTICVGITWRPNGYLIEAAPKMLKTLELIARCAPLARDPILSAGTLQAALQDVIENAANAIKLARGEASPS